MKLYVAGPMRGVEDFNFPAFDAGAAWLRGAGHEVFNPAEADRARMAADGTTEVQLRDVLGEDTAWICAHADGLVALPGASRSSGATAEMALCRALGLPLFRFTYSSLVSSWPDLAPVINGIKDYTPEGIMW